jgi:hypothetical protein
MSVKNTTSVKGIKKVTSYSNKIESRNVLSRDNDALFLSNHPAGSLIKILGQKCLKIYEAGILNSSVAFPSEALV